MENIVRKEEIAYDKQFVLFSQCFLPYMALYFHFKRTLKCRLQFVSIWKSIILSSGNGLTIVRKMPFENIVGKPENSVTNLPYQKQKSIFKQHFICCLQMLWIWSSPKNYRVVMS